MYERHFLSVRDLFKGIEAGEPYSKFGHTVELTRGKIKFVGFLVEKSIVIPTNGGRDSEDSILAFIGANLEVVRLRSKEKALPATCHLLGLPYNGHTGGLYSDGQNFGQITGIHFHPKEHIDTQEDFIKLATKALSSAGSKLTILE